MKRLLNLFVLIFTILLFSCGGNKPEQIIIGEDICAHCKMKIMDNRYGAELITTKGKVYKYDAVECIIKQNMIGNDEIETQYVIDFSHPGNLAEANNSFYLISEKLPSPMGANLTSFKDKVDAEKNQKEFGGTVYNWQEIFEHIKTSNEKSHQHKH